MDLSKIFLIISLVIVSYLIYITFTGNKPTTATTSASASPFTNTNDNNTEHFNYQENFDGYTDDNNLAGLDALNQPVNFNAEDIEREIKDGGMTQESDETIEQRARDEAESRGIDFEKRGIDPEAGLMDEDNVLNVEGTDLLIAAAADRFYSIDTKGQSNRNASNDLRGDLPIPYNESYTPFYASHIYGEPLVPAGRL